MFKTWHNKLATDNLTQLTLTACKFVLLCVLRREMIPNHSLIWVEICVVLKGEPQEMDEVYVCVGTFLDGEMNPVQK